MGGRFAHVYLAGFSVGGGLADFSAGFSAPAGGDGGDSGGEPRRSLGVVLSGVPGFFESSFRLFKRLSNASLAALVSSAFGAAAGPVVGRFISPGENSGR